MRSGMPLSSDKKHVARRQRFVGSRAGDRHRNVPDGLFVVLPVRDRDRVDTPFDGRGTVNPNVNTQIYTASRV